MLERASLAFDAKAVAPAALRHGVLLALGLISARSTGVVRA